MGKNIATIIKDSELVKIKRKQISDAAVKLFLSKGYGETSVREIANASGLSMGTLYNYINSKEDILYLVYNEMTGLIHNSVEKKNINSGDPLTDLMSVLKAALEVAMNDAGEHILILYREGGVLSRESLHAILGKESKFVKTFERILLEGKKGNIFQITNADLTANIIVFLLVFGALRRWNINKYSNEEIIDAIIEFILGGILGIRKNYTDKLNQ